MEPSRRDVLKAAALAAVPVPSALAMEPAKPRLDVLRDPDLVRAWGADGELDKGAYEVCYVGGALTLRANVGVTRIQLRWRGDLRWAKAYLGDHWERSYADLGWQGERPARPMPWSFLATDGGRTDGYGVMVRPGAMCFWTADTQGVSLWADVRSGGSPVRLGDRTLAVCAVVSVSGGAPFGVQQALCRAMCPAPRLADHPVYGTNDWNYAYGNNSAELVAGVSGLVSELSPDGDNRPYSVIDEGWAMGPFNGKFGHGPWEGNPRFGDMGTFAGRLKGLGVRPGIWFRPLTALPDSPASWRLPRDRDYLDPTLPETHAHVAEHLRRFAGWGYKMVKHDFTSWDLFGRWGFEMGPSVTADGWRFHDDAKTSAEVVLELYRTIREAAGAMRLIGCNTFSHLAAGTHEVQRTGDDTSGRSWNRTRRMGVNTLAFRAAQHGALYAVDPDIVAITKAIPWRLNEQWLRLVAGSGAALFVSVEPSFVDETHKAALKKALAQAARVRPVAEPLDWLHTDTPRVWRLDGKRTEFAWMEAEGASPYGD